MKTIESDQPDEFIISSMELYFLINLVGDKGLPDKDTEAFIRKSCSSDSPDHIWREGRESLIRRRYFIPGADGELRISAQLLITLCHIFLAKKAYLHQYILNGREYEEFLYIHEEKVIRIECLKSDEGQYRLTYLNIDDNELVQSFGCTEQKLQNPGELPALMLSRSQFEEMISRSSELSTEELIQQLSNTTDDQEAVIALARCIKSNTSKGLLRFYIWNHNTWEVQCVQYMCNHHVNWLIRSSANHDEDWMIATPTSMEKIQEMIKDWLTESTS
ncbi:hypothetical protein RE628_16370 [Paenibacillus sp. D2_2]|uniref:hypothetical protein n=1 Tax=Paenibacillus sp. D2_2 TaxID=3073092 RepID=UPI002815C510|nr:hypothetical protein [Paenibacillus sp. D2_2]WMT39081.1 hypothetical protein RE628_16370 [Paenibacillus sp. D2_2]